MSGDEQTDRVGPLIDDPAAPGLRATGGLGRAPSLEDVPGASIGVSGDATAWSNGWPLGLLLPHYLNASVHQPETAGFNRAAYLLFVGRATH